MSHRNWLRQGRRALKETCYGVSARALREFVLRLSDESACRVGRCLGSMAFRLATKDAQRTRRHLADAFPGTSDGQIDTLARSCFEHLGISVVEVLRFARLSRQNIGRYVEVSGVEHLDGALRRGRGFIALMAHFGNWELCGAALGLYGYRVTALVRDLRSATLDGLVKQQRARVGIEPISRGRSLRAAVRALRENVGLCILADVDTSVRGTFVDFFGRPAYTPIGPVVLSQRYGAPAHPVFLRRIDGMRHRLEIGPAIEWQRTGDAEADLHANTARFTQIIERQIRSAPAQWIWMHDRWKTRPPGASGPMATGGETSHRIMRETR